MVLNRFKRGIKKHLEKNDNGNLTHHNYETQFSQCLEKFKGLNRVLRNRKA